MLFSLIIGHGLGTILVAFGLTLHIMDYMLLGTHNYYIAIYIVSIHAVSKI